MPALFPFPLWLTQKPRKLVTPPTKSTGKNGFRLTSLPKVSLVNSRTGLCHDCYEHCFGRHQPFRKCVGLCLYAQWRWSSHAQVLGVTQSSSMREQTKSASMLCAGPLSPQSRKKSLVWLQNYREVKTPVPYDSLELLSFSSVLFLSKTGHRIITSLQ